MKHGIGIGIVGAGFLAETRARCYRQLGDPARLRAVASRDPDRARAYARRHEVGQVCGTLEELLAIPEIDVVDLCVPNLLHRPMAVAAAAAGKHVICTKPLAAYVGQDLRQDAPDSAAGARDPALMLEIAEADARAMVEAAATAGIRLMYGENWIYAPAIRRARELVGTSRGAILEMEGEESHSGSHSPYSKVWRHAGGGALIRLAAHPLGAMIHLKSAEGRARSGRPIRPVSVTAEVGDLSPTAELAAPPSRVAGGWRDVENWGCVIVTFEDGARGVARGSDNLLGGMRSHLRINASNCHLQCNLSPHDLLRAYAPDGEVFGDAYIMEKVDGSAGWSTPLPNEDWSSGHLDMCRDFIDAVAEDRPPVADGELGLEVTRVIYSAYLSAAEGRRVMLP